ncbi:MAG TPA: HDOD domain-containing protein [Gammaproteobacteria bacterium]
MLAARDIARAAADERGGEMESTDTVILDGRYAQSRAASLSLIAELERSVADKELKLPSLPDVVLRIRDRLADETVSLGEIVELVGSDPALSARLMQTANSALFYRGNGPVTTLHMAVARLGFRMVRNVALSLAAQQIFIGYETRAVHEPLSVIWRHSVHVAALAHRLARLKTDMNPEEAFLAGLLHEVGKLYIVMQCKDRPELAASEAFEGVVAQWHGRVGKVVIETWGLAPELAAAVAGHETEPLEVAEPVGMTALVAVANFLAEHVARGGESLADCPPLGALSLDEETFGWLLKAGDVDIKMLMLAFGT